METGALTQRDAWSLHARLARARRALEPGWVVLGSVALAAAAGVVVGSGEWELGLSIAVVPAFLLAVTANPDRAALALIVALPFFVYPLTVGGLSLFLAVPTFGLVSIVLLSRQRGSWHVLRGDLPMVAFGVLFALALGAALLSTDPKLSLSRVAYLALFCLFAFSLATSLAAGRLSREAVGRALLISGALAAAAIVVQFVAQFGVGKDAVLDWLFGVESLFGGERAAEVRKSNWMIDDLDVVRGVFPFMTAPSAGQFLMFAAIAGVWLRRVRSGARGLASALEVAALALVAAGLLFTFSRQAWLGAAVGIALLGFARRPLWTVALAVQVAIVLTLVPIPGAGGSFGDYLLTAGDTSTESTDTRLELWEQTVDLIPEYALIGAGPGLIEELGPGTSDRPFYAHNVFLDSAVELALAGALALIALFALGLRAAYRRRSMLAFSLLAAYLVAGLFDDVLYLPRNGLLLAVAFALIAGPRAAGKTRRSNTSGEAATRSSRRPAEPEPTPA
jgi:O-antigen ligase